MFKTLAEFSVMKESYGMILFFEYSIYFIIVKEPTLADRIATDVTYF